MKKIFITLVCLALASTAMAQNKNIYARPNSSWMADSVLNPLWNWVKWADPLIQSSGGVQPGRGKIYYVDVNVDNAGDGSSWSNAKATLNGAVDVADPNSIIYIAQGSTEAMGAAADEVDVDVAGLTIIQVGDNTISNGFDYTGTVAGAFAIGADNVTLVNLRFHANTPDVNNAVNIEAGSIGATFIGCLFDTETPGTDEFHEVLNFAGANSNHLRVQGCTFLMGAGAARSGIAFLDSDYAVIAWNSFFGDFAIGDVNNVTTASIHIDISHNTFFQGTVGGTAGLNTVPCVVLVATTSGVMQNNNFYTNVATPGAAVTGADMFRAGNTYSETEAIDGIPVYLDDNVNNILGFDDAANLGTTSNITSDRDGSIAERLEFLVKYFETGTPGALVAPANTFSLLDILGSDGSTTTGAVAGSLLGAIGTDEASASTAFASTSVQADSDGSVLERLEQIDVDTSAIATSTSSTTGSDYWRETTVSKAGTNNAITEDLFDVAGGNIYITSFTCYVTETIDSNAATCKIIITRDDSAAATDFTTAVNIENDVLGSLWIFTAANPAVLTPLTPGSTGTTNLMNRWFCPEGMVSTIFSVTNLDGSITYYLSYIPLATGITVTAQ